MNQLSILKRIFTHWATSNGNGHNPNNQRGSRNLWSAITSQVDDSAGWQSYTGRPHDYDPSEISEIYQDALEAWRKNPIAWRAVAITTDFIVGDKFSLTSPNRSLDKFIRAFWNHPKNKMSQRLDSMCDELSRSGDLFVLLFRNPADGMSYIRFVTKDRIQAIETAANDWETELVYYEMSEVGSLEQKRWLSASNPDASTEDAIMLHYTINQPIGALLGESDLTTMTPWLKRYSRMLEDRVRLNWAIRSFLWMVTVPASKVFEKREQYRTPPEAGSIIVKDESETWEPVAPLLRGADAKPDMAAVRGMIDAGSGYPPHWRGDAGDISLATAQAMQGPTERHLRRRQLNFSWMCQDIIYHAYQRAVEIGRARRLASSNYDELFRNVTPEISRWDNESLASAARDVAQAFYNMSSQLGSLPEEYGKLVLQTVMKFAGEPLTEEKLETLIAALKAHPPVLEEDNPANPIVKEVTPDENIQ
jgi:hypothetical protein